MHTNRPLFNLPGEGVSLYQSPVIVKFIIPDIALVSHDTTRVADPSVSGVFTKPYARRLDLQLFTGPQPGPDTHSRSSPSAGRDAAKWVFTCSPGIHCRAPPRRRGDQRFESISLHRRVGCEPDFPDHGCSISAPIAPRVDRDRLAQPFSGRSPISGVEDAGEPQAFCRTEFVGSAALAIQFRQKLQRWGGCGPNPFPHASFAGGTPMAARYAVARRSGWEDSDNQDGNPASRH